MIGTRATIRTDDGIVHEGEVIASGMATLPTSASLADRIAVWAHAVRVGAAMVYHQALDTGHKVSEWGMEHPEIMDLIHKGAGFAQGELVAHGLPPAQVTTLTRGVSAAMRALAAGDVSVCGSQVPTYAVLSSDLAQTALKPGEAKMQNKPSEDRAKKG